MKALIGICLLGLMTGCSEPDRPLKQPSEVTEAHASARHVEVFDTLSDQEEAADVIEFFSYRCPHCQVFAPLLADWAAQKGMSVEYMPIVWNTDTELYARFFYLTRHHADAQALHQQLFEQVMQLDSEAPVEQQKTVLIQWAQEQGMKPDDISEGLSSPALQVAIERSSALARHYQIASTPTLVVKGTDKILNRELTGYQHLLDIAEQRLRNAP